MQKGVVLDRAPVASIERVGADEVECAADPASRALGHYQENAVSHLGADDREELSREIRPSPLARTGFHVEGEEGVPDLLGEIGTVEPVDVNACGQGLLAFPPNGLAFARGQAREKIVEGGIVQIVPVELLIGALEKATAAEHAPLAFRQESDVR